MNITRKSLITTGCGIVLACGAIVIQVLLTSPMAGYFSLSVQKGITYFIFFYSMLILAPLISRWLNRLENIKKILGWTFIGVGAEFLILPFPLIILALKSSLWVAMVFVFSVFVGLIAGLINMAIGIYFIRSANIQ
jgi:hypothetical protein